MERFERYAVGLRRGSEEKQKQRTALSAGVDRLTAAKHARSEWTPRSVMMRVASGRVVSAWLSAEKRVHSAISWKAHRSSVLSYIACRRPRESQSSTGSSTKATDGLPAKWARSFDRSVDLPTAGREWGRKKSGRAWQGKNHAACVRAVRESALPILPSMDRTSLRERACGFS